MPKITQYQCDFPGCDVVRGKTNHWYVVQSFIYVREYDDVSESKIVILPLNEENANLPGALILCGAGHVMQHVSLNLTNLFPD